MNIYLKMRDIVIILLILIGYVAFTSFVWYHQGLKTGLIQGSSLGQGSMKYIPMDDSKPCIVTKETLDNCQVYFNTSGQNL